jgi:hypothetical protein
MHLKYLHYPGNESSENLLEVYGIVTKDKLLSDALRPKQCPNCLESNIPDSKFCAKCRMVLTYDAYNETLESEKQKDDKLSLMENTVNTMQSQIQSLISAFSNMQDQNQVDGMAKTLYGSGLIKEATTTTTTVSSSPSIATDLEKQKKQLIREAGKAAYHATTTRSALSMTTTPTASRGRRKKLISIDSNLPKVNQ